MIMIKILALSIMLMGAVGITNAGSQSESAVFAGGCFGGGLMRSLSM